MDIGNFRLKRIIKSLFGCLDLDRKFSQVESGPDDGLGLLPIGKELSFDKDDTIEVKKFRGKYITYSTSNRQSSIEVSDYRVYLIKADSKKKNLLARFEKEDEAMEESRNIMALIP